MIDLYKYMHGLYDTDRPSFKTATKLHATSGNTMTLPKTRALHQLRSNSFAHRVINSWNSLPDNVVLAPSVNAFKNRLDKQWENLPSLYDPDCLN